VQSVVQVTVQQVILYAQILLPPVTVQAVAQSLIVAPVLTIPMVYAGIQHVVVILAALHLIMVQDALPANLVTMVDVLSLFLLGWQASTAQPITIDAMVQELV